MRDERGTRVPSGISAAQLAIAAPEHCRPISAIERRAHVGARGGANDHFRHRVHVEAVVVKSVEEATVPSE